jgi:hypothetical protein
MMKKWPPLAAFLLSSLLHSAEPSKTIPWRLDIRVYSGKSDRLSQNEQYDDRAVKLGFKIEIKNLDFRKKLEKARATLVAFGKHVNSGNRLKVMLRHEFPVEVEVNQIQTEKSGEVMFEYDERESAQFGYKYLGYVLVIHNDKGEVIGIRGTPPMFVTHIDKILPLKLNTVIDRDFRPAVSAPL